MKDNDFEYLTQSIIGLGNPLLDIVANVDEDFIQRYGLVLDNAILAEERHKPMFDELENQCNPEYIAGGSTQNTIRVVQWMLNHINTRSTCFFGSIGKDKNGARLKECAKQDNIHAVYSEHNDIATGVCAVCVLRKERSLVANLSAANVFDCAHLESEISKKLIESGRFYFVSAFHLTVSPEAILILAQHAHAKNKHFMLGLAAPFIMNLYTTELLSILPYVDYVFGNDVEAREFGRVHDWGENLIDIAVKIASLPKNSGLRSRTVVITQASDPTIVMYQGKVMLFQVPPVNEEDIVETNGAGDAFVGGFISRLVLQKSIEECVNAGHYAASVVICRSGCTFPRVCAYINGNV